MEYIITFLEGILTFISPCLLPMLPIYISYFMGQDSKKSNAIINSLGFVLGFSIVFILLGIFASTFGMFIRNYIKVINIVFGILIIILGLSYIPKLKINLFNKLKPNEIKIKRFNFFSSILFGILFSISWTPCIGTFLGSALMLVASTGKTLQGVLMLICYSLGLGIPFVLSAILIDRLKNAFNFIKKHYEVINTICGILLVIIGILVSLGIMEKLIII